MQIVLVLFVQVLRYLSLRFLPPPQYNRDEWSFVCGAHSSANNIKKISSNILLLWMIHRGHYQQQGRISPLGSPGVKTAPTHFAQCSQNPPFLPAQVFWSVSLWKKTSFVQFRCQAPLSPLVSYLSCTNNFPIKEKMTRVYSHVCGSVRLDLRQDTTG